MPLLIRQIIKNHMLIMPRLSNIRHLRKLKHILNMFFVGNGTRENFQNFFSEIQLNIVI